MNLLFSNLKAFLHIVFSFVSTICIVNRCLNYCPPPFMKVIRASVFCDVIIGWPYYPICLRLVRTINICDKKVEKVARMCLMWIAKVTSQCYLVQNFVNSPNGRKYVFNSILWMNFVFCCKNIHFLLKNTKKERPYCANAQKLVWFPMYTLY